MTIIHRRTFEKCWCGVSAHSIYRVHEGERPRSPGHTAVLRRPHQCPWLVFLYGGSYPREMHLASHPSLPESALFHAPVGAGGAKTGVRDIKSVWFWGKVLTNALSSKSKAMSPNYFILKQMKALNFNSALYIYHSDGPKLGRIEG